MHEAEIEGMGVSVGDESMGAPAVILRVRDELIPIFIGPDQARSIQLALEGVPFERPLTHDLMVEMLTDVGGAIDRVRIDDLANNTFYAKIDLELIRDGERRKFVFDARPSDGIAIALRVECPIEVASEVVDEAGLPPDEFNPDDIDPEDILD